MEGIPTVIECSQALSFCESCVNGKLALKPFQNSKTRSLRKLQLVYRDICGSLKTHLLGRNRYFITFMDDYSQDCAVYIIKHKSEALAMFKEFEAAAVKMPGNNIGTLRTDNAGECHPPSLRII